MKIISKGASPFIIGSTLGSIPGFFLFLNSLDSHGSSAKAILLWIVLCICLSIFAVIFDKKPDQKRKRGLKYAKKGFFIILSLSLIPIWWTLYNASGAGGFTVAAALQLVFLFMTIALLISLPLFLIGYFIAPRKVGEGQQ